MNTWQSYRARFHIVSWLAYCSLLAVADSTFGEELATGFDGKRGTYEELIEAMRNIDDQQVDDTKLQTTSSMAELFEGQRKWRESIESIKVEFQANIPLEPSEPQGAIDAGERLVAAFETIYAEKGVKQFRSYRDLSGRAGSVEMDDAEPDILYAFDGEQMRQVNMGARSGAIQKHPIANLADLANLLFEALSYPVDDDRERAKHRTSYLPTALQSNRYHLLPHLQRVDGFLCHVVTSGNDTFWIDATNGFVMRRRILFRLVSDDQTGVLQSLYICQDVRQYSELVWLPCTVRRLDFATQERPPSARGKLIGTNEFEAEWSVNNVADSQFRIEFPAGFLILNHDNGTQFLAPAGEELLDQAVANARRMPGVRLNNDEDIGRGRGVSWLLILNIGALIMLLALLARRYLFVRASV